MTLLCIHAMDDIYNDNLASERMYLYYYSDLSAKLDASVSIQRQNCTPKVKTKAMNPTITIDNELQSQAEIVS